MDLTSFQFPRRARKGIKRLGRGRGSGHGKTCCRGVKGQSSRTGYSQKPGFEGGQNPMQRRLPKRGFTNIFRTEYEGLNLDRLAGFEAGTEVTVALLKEKGLVKKAAKRVKILGNGEISHALTIEAHGFSKSAQAKIEAAGGTVKRLAR